MFREGPKFGRQVTLAAAALLRCTTCCRWVEVPTSSCVIHSTQLCSPPPVRPPSLLSPSHSPSSRPSQDPAAFARRVDRLAGLSHLRIVGLLGSCPQEVGG